MLWRVNLTNIRGRSIIEGDIEKERQRRESLRVCAEGNLTYKEKRGVEQYTEKAREDQQTAIREAAA